MTMADEMKELVRDRTLAAATLVGVEVREQLREDTPKLTGRTSRGWYVTPPFFDGVAVQFNVHHPQGPEDPPDVQWLNLGTRGHGPRVAPFLHFKGSDGQWVRTRWVNGITGTGFIDRILSQSNLEGVVARAWAAM